MRSSPAPNRMALPPPLVNSARSRRLDRYPDVRRMPAAAILRAKIVLTAVALTAAVLLVAMGSWPLKVLVVLVFGRGLFAADLIAFRNE